MTERTPWAAWLTHACAALALPPAAFWLLSLREWRALTTPPDGAPLRRAAFEALTRAFPDR